jgi:hypothetical protein
MKAYLRILKSRLYCPSSAQFLFVFVRLKQFIMRNEKRRCFQCHKFAYRTFM